MTSYYNEIDKKAAAWLRELIAEGLIAPGDVDERSITDVDPNELAGYRQLHFFAGVGGWAVAARLAGWPDDREIVTGSCPCQPFSVAGKGAGTADARHLWPDFFRIIRARRPACVMGEQVAAAVGKDWLLGVRTDMEGIGYDLRPVIIPACAVNAPQLRYRLWFAARDGTLGHGHGQGLAQRERFTGIPGRTAGAPSRQDATDAGPLDGGLLEFASGVGRREGRAESELWSRRTTPAGAGVSHGHVAVTDLAERGPDLAARDDSVRHQARRHEITSNSQQRGDGALADTSSGQYQPGGAQPDQRPVARGHAERDAWASAKWLIGHDEKARRVEPSVPLLVNGIPHRAPLIRGYGNAIVPQIAAEMMAAWLEEFPSNVGEPA